MACYSVPLNTFSNSIRLTYSSLHKTHVVFFFPSTRTSNFKYFWMHIERERLNSILEVSMAQKKNSTLGMRLACRSDTLVTPFQSARRHIPEEGIGIAYRISNVFQQFHILKKMRGWGQYILCRPSSTVLVPLSVNISRWNYDSLCGILKQTSKSCKKCSAYSAWHKTYLRVGDAF